jgi:hypothetical protein
MGATVSANLTDVPGGNGKAKSSTSLVAGTQAKAKAPEPSRPVLVNKLKPGETPAAATAALAVAGLASNSMAIREWSEIPFGPGTVDATECLNAVVDSAERVNRSDLGDAEALLMAQATTLNAVFTNLLHRSHETQYLQQFEVYMRLALKAQSQCRATCEALAVLKNPPIFAKNANVAQNQQINNSSGPQQVNNVPGESCARANCGSGQTKLLEAHGERLDSETTGTAGAGHLALAAVGTLDRTAHAGRQSARVAERVPRRQAAGTPGVREGAQRDARHAGATAERHREVV